MAAHLRDPRGRRAKTPARRRHSDPLDVHARPTTLRRPLSTRSEPPTQKHHKRGGGGLERQRLRPQLVRTQKCREVRDNGEPANPQCTEPIRQWDPGTPDNRPLSTTGNLALAHVAETRN